MESGLCIDKCHITEIWPILTCNGCFEVVNQGRLVSHRFSLCAYSVENLFFQAAVCPVTWPTVPQYWEKHKALTDISGQSLSCLYLPVDPPREGAFVAALMPAHLYQIWPVKIASCDKFCWYRAIRVWDIREPVMSPTYGGTKLSSSKAKVDAKADAGGKHAASYTIMTGLLRKVVWPVSSVNDFFCASDECYLWAAFICAHTYNCKLLTVILAGALFPALWHFH